MNSENKSRCVQELRSEGRKIKSRIRPSKNPDNFKYHMEFKKKLQVNDWVEFALSPYSCDGETESPLPPKTQFWFVEQRPTANTIRPDCFCVADDLGNCIEPQPSDQKLAPGVYASRVEYREDIKAEGSVLRLRATRGRLGAKGGLALGYIVSVDGFAPDDPDMEIEC